MNIVMTKGLINIFELISRSELNEVDDWDAPLARLTPHDAGRYERSHISNVSARNDWNAFFATIQEAEEIHPHINFSRISRRS